MLLSACSLAMLQPVLVLMCMAAGKHLDFQAVESENVSADLNLLIDERL
jgi:hypothetical protein